MTFSMYDVCVPGLVRTINAMSAILDKAAAHCAAKKIDPAVVVNFRLAADMFPFSRQIQIMSDQAKGLMARLAGDEPPVFPDTEVTFDDLKARLAKTLAYVESFKPDQISGTEDKTVTLKAGSHELKFTGRKYANEFVFPNFYFHATTAYNILRHVGVEIGKLDFLGGL